MSRFSRSWLVTASTHSLLPAPSKLYETSNVPSNGAISSAWLHNSWASSESNSNTSLPGKSAEQSGINGVEKSVAVVRVSSKIVEVMVSWSMHLDSEDRR